ncbi:MAG: DmsE family decaheme c-type cytochrome [Rhodocyclaceae bacterium]|nr:DmsE family decaheme c-type cytochrome [Rhodocyclaceae bacterium]
MFMRRESRPWRHVVAAGLLVVAMASGLAQAREVNDVYIEGDKVCTRCHDENEYKPVLSIAQTRHGTAADGRAPTCVSCHGESDTHINKPADVEKRPEPTINFGRKSTTPVADRNQVCESCHQGGKFIHWQGSQHSAADVECGGCHTMHTAHDKVRDKATQPEVCMNCHKEKRGEIRRPNHHPLAEGKMACSDCHASHGSAGEKLMQRDTINDTCYTCHMEKRGPTVRTHQPVMENCAICHNPHGSVNDNLLRQRPPLLCQQCHEPTGHRGGIPGFGDSRGSFNSTGGMGITQGRSCLNCHSNIHGTNNPVDASNERTFRR